MPNKIKIKDLTVEYGVVYRNIKYPRLELKKGHLEVILPLGYNEHQKFVNKHKDWIHKRLHTINEAKEASKDRNLNMDITDEEFKKHIKYLVNDFSSVLGVKTNRIYFRTMKSKWGSCSSKNNITFNILLKYLPSKLVEYVVFHELVHILEKKHNKHFWSIINQKFDDYKELENELLIYWFSICNIMIKGAKNRE